MIRPFTAGEFAYVGWYSAQPHKAPFIRRAHAVHDLVRDLPHAPDDEHAIAVHHARQIVSFYEHYALPRDDQNVYRDARAAKHVRWWQRLSGDRIVYWAANVHTANAPQLRIVQSAGTDLQYPTAGSYLRRWYSGADGYMTGGSLADWLDVVVHRHQLSPAKGRPPRQRSSQRKEHRMTTGSEHLPSGTTEPPLPDGVWNVDPRRSEIGFAVKDMWGLRTVRGVFGAYDGSLKVRGGRAAGELTIQADSLDTGSNRRDRHLRSKAFFDVEQHPRIVFAATAVTARDGGLAVTGELAIGSSRVRLEIPVIAQEMADGALRLEGFTTVSRTAAGLAWNKLGMIRGDAALHAQLTLAPAAS